MSNQTEDKRHAGPPGRSPRARNFADCVAIVTGAASGIGEALAAELAQKGARVTLCDIDERAVTEVAERLRRAGGQVYAARVDVTAADAVRALIAETVQRDGRLDLLINNAGIGVGGEAHEISLADWRRVLDVNLHGVIHGVQAAYPILVRQGGGHIVNIASVAGLAPYPLTAPYVTSKHAVVGLSLSLRAEAAAYGVRVSVACPGAIRTAIWHKSPMRGDWDRERLLKAMPLKTSAESCARTILRGVERNEAIILVTLEARLMWWLQRLCPSLSLRLHSGIAARARALRRPT